MQELTLEYVNDNLAHNSELVKYFKPDATKEEIDFILWEKTCFPFDLERTIRQLNEYFIKNEKLWHSKKKIE